MRGMLIIQVVGDVTDHLNYWRQTGLVHGVYAVHPIVKYLDIRQTSVENLPQSWTTRTLFLSHHA